MQTTNQQQQQLEASIKKNKNKILAKNQALLKEPLWNWQEAPLEIQYVISFIGRYLELSDIMIVKIQQWSQGPADLTKSPSGDENRSERLVLNLYDLAKVATEIKQIIDKHPDHRNHFETILKKINLKLDHFESEYVAKTNDIQGLLQGQKSDLVNPIFNEFLDAYLEMSYQQLQDCAPVLTLTSSVWKNFKKWYPTILFTSSEWNINAYHKIKHHFYNLYHLVSTVQSNPNGDLNDIVKLKQIIQLPKDWGIRLLFVHNFKLDSIKNHVDPSIWKELKPISITTPSDGIYANPDLVPKTWKQAVVE